MRLIKHFGLAALYLCFSANLFAAQIGGTVTNGTTNKPSSGDEVVLLSLAGGMDEVAHAKTDAQGRFTLNVPDQGGQNLVRVDHQGASYFKPAPQGTAILDVTVYDAAKEVDHLVAEGRVLRFQTVPDGKGNTQLEVSEMFIVRNESNPPRTKTGDRSFEFDLPAGAQIEEGMVEGPGGMPTTSSPVPAGKKNRYGFSFPLRPGRSRFQVTYKVPYAGTREFKISPETPLAELGIMVPKSMQFNSSDSAFAPAQDESGMTVFVAKSVAQGKELKFSVAGEGTMPAAGQGGGGGAPQGQEAGGRPGGGLGAPIEAPDPLSGSRWYIVGIFVVALGAGGFWLFRMQRGTANPLPAAAGDIPQRTSPKVRNGQSTAAAARPASSPSSNGATGSGVLEAIKEELFQLETDRLQGKLSQQEYETTKAGLETLMRRHLKKS